MAVLPIVRLGHPALRTPADPVPVERLAAVDEPLYAREKWNFYTRLNHQRMKRLNKTVSLIEEVVAAGSRVPCRMTWLVLTEGWCGDAAQILPVLNLLTERFDNLELGLLFRDQNLELMDERPERVTIIGIVPEDLTLGTELSTAGREGVERGIDFVLEDLATLGIRLTPVALAAAGAG